MGKKEIQNYLELITKDRDIKKVSDETIEYYFEELLKILPNQGKLYKYRSFNSKSFGKMLDSLKNKYIYVPSAKDLNDRLDTTIIYKIDKCPQDIENYYYKNRYFIYKFHCHKNGVKDWPKMFIIDSLARGKNQEEILLGIIDQIPKGKTYSIPTINKSINNVKSDVDRFIDSIKEGAIKSFEDMDINFRNDYRIFSMSELYNQDSMWAYYSDNNNGYCIEYDFRKGNKCSREIKENLICLSKIYYSDKKEIIDLFKIYDVVYKIDNTNESFLKYNRQILRNFLTKRKSWRHEKEWRLFLILDDPKLYCDIVSGIIIDESAFEKNDDKVKRLIKIADENNWSIKVRMFDRIKCNYKYISHKRFLKYRQIIF